MLKNTRSNGSDGTLTSFFHNFRFFIAILYSFHFLDDFYPKMFSLLFTKMCSVTSVLKLNGSFNICHYMLISIIPHLAKLFKSLVYSQISKTLNYIVFEEQRGFILGKSTVTSSVAFATYISEVIEHGGQVDVVLTDFKKAFNTVDHNCFIGELESLGTGTHFFPDLVLIHPIESNLFITLSRLYLVYRIWNLKRWSFKSFSFNVVRKLD